MDYSKRRWVVFAASCLINLCLGSIYAWSVFAGGMAEYLTAQTGQTITTADLAIVYTIANSVGPITMISGGWFNDKFGPKKVIMLGGAMFGIGMILSGFVKSVNMLIITYGLISGLGLGMAYGTTVSTCMKFFPDKRGIIGGITTAIYGLGSVILPPIVTSLVTNFDGAKAFIIVGAVFLVIVVGSSFFMEQCPSDFVPDGYTPVAQKVSTNNLTWKDMLKTSSFYVMLLLFTCGAFSGMMIISQASAVAQNQVGMTLATASLAVSMLALFNAAGRILAGALSDKIGRINTLTVASALSIVGLFILSQVGKGQTALFLVGLAIVGLCFGSFMGIYPGFTADRFGGKNNSINYGIMFIGVALAGYFGPTIMRSVFNSTGAYAEAFTIAMIFAIVGLVLTFIYRLTERKKD